MVNYSLGKIYKIASPSCDSVYIGSTTKKYLCDRMAKHKSDYVRWFNGNNRWMFSFLLIGFGDAYIELIEDYPCNSRDQLNQRERIIMESYTNCINKNSPYRTDDENDILTYQRNKMFRENNKEYVRAYMSEYYRRKTLKQMSETPVETPE